MSIFLNNFTRVMTLIMKIALLRASFSFSVTSWWRTVKRNNDVGGLPKSLHLKGLALDIVLDNLEDDEEFKAAAGDLGIHVYKEDDHLHCYERSFV